MANVVIAHPRGAPASAVLRRVLHLYAGHGVKGDPESAGSQALHEREAKCLLGHEKLLLIRACGTDEVEEVNRGGGAGGGERGAYETRP